MREVYGVHVTNVLIRRYEGRSNNRSDGLVGYDTTLTRLGPRVRLPLGVDVLFFLHLRI